MRTSRAVAIGLSALVAAALTGVLVNCAAPQRPAGSGLIVSARYGRSLRGSVDGLPLLVLRGTHRERGEAHGFLGAREIIRTCDAMAGAIDEASGAGTTGVGWEAARELVESQFRFPARFQEELRGMVDGLEKALPKARDRRLRATGAEITLEDLKVMQCFDVLELMRCSQFSAWGSLTPDGSTIIGRDFDYPFIFPADTYCILAVDPAEDGLQKTLDAAWFGGLWAGIACLNEGGLYVAANLNEGAKGDPSAVRSPIPVALALRVTAETAGVGNALATTEENIDQKIALATLCHIVAPAEPEDQAEQAFVFEHAPGATSPFEARVRRSSPTLPDALIVTNAPLIGGSPGGEVCWRYARIEQALSDHDAQGRVDFEKARSILDSVAVSSPSTTLYSAVVWPAQREMRIAVAPAPGEVATKQHYARVQWSAVFGLR